MSRMLLVAVLLMAGCGKKQTHVTATAVSTTTSSPGFVDLSGDDDEDLDALMGSELMVADAECGNLLSLEPMAMLGRLGEGEIRCLERGYHEAEKQTAKRKVSLLLMVDAWTKGDKHRWETLVRRHLEEVDQSDPDLCYKFALLLADKGPEDAPEAMKWADVALENRSRFPQGDTYVARVYGLLKLKAKAAAKYWSWQEEEFLKDPTEERKAQVDESRGKAKTLAREWLEYARSSGKDDTVAYQLCVSAAGSSDFCTAT